MCHYPFTCICDHQKSLYEKGTTVLTAEALLFSSHLFSSHKERKTGNR